MLILARKADEAIVIGNDITVRVLEIKGGQVKLGVEAPARVMIHREEIFKRIMAENKRAGLDAPTDLADMLDVLKAGVWKLPARVDGLLDKVGGGGKEKL